MEGENVQRLSGWRLSNGQIQYQERGGWGCLPRLVKWHNQVWKKRFKVWKSVTVAWSNNWIPWIPEQDLVVRHFIIFVYGTPQMLSFKYSWNQVAMCLHFIKIELQSGEGVFLYYVNWYHYSIIKPLPLLLFVNCTLLMVITDSVVHSASVCASKVLSKIQMLLLWWG